MKAPIIVSAVLLFFCVLLFLPVSVRIKYDKTFAVRIYYGIIKVFDTKKQKKENRKEQHKKDNGEKDEPKKESFIKRDLDKMGKIEFIKFYAAVLKDVLIELKALLSHISFKIFDFTLAVGSEDAFDTAIAYGAVNAALNPVFYLLFENAKVKAKRINIYADFAGQGVYLQTDVKLDVCLIFILISAVKLLKIYKALSDGTYEIKTKKDDNSPTPDNLTDKNNKESVKTDER